MKAWACLCSVPMSGIQIYDQAETKTLKKKNHKCKFDVGKIVLSLWRNLILVFLHINGYLILIIFSPFLAKATQYKKKYCTLSLASMKNKTDFRAII